MCPQAAPLLEFTGLPTEILRRRVKCVDFKVFWPACFVIVLSQTAPIAASGSNPVVFFTKLSTESVHDVWAGRRHVDAARHPVLARG
jgi:hypothetical protein